MAFGVYTNCLSSFPPSIGQKWKILQINFDIVNTHNDEICYVKHVLAPLCVFLTSESRPRLMHRARQRTRTLYWLFQPAQDIPERPLGRLDARHCAGKRTSGVLSLLGAEAQLPEQLAILPTKGGPLPPPTGAGSGPKPP